MMIKEGFPEGTTIKVNLNSDNNLTFNVEKFMNKIEPKNVMINRILGFLDLKFIIIVHWQYTF
ncbi:chaperone protein ClpB [Staphylococcus aureus]|uniref:Chaperone protein ClpB n=1 Tax=Staphylococcus aureus TaxID=1280 RepID=A0A380DN07_STAAU|nr:chaperone protein ClpB [Staphylococcus aureus]